MPPRRTSPRRAATRPSGLNERTLEPVYDELDDEPGGGFFARAAPWLALLALVIAAGVLGYVVFSRTPGEDLTACRTSAWKAIPDPDNLPPDWNLGSTDLNANGMTISILGPASEDGSTNPPVVYASVTCYGDAAEAALAQNRAAAAAAGSTVTNRTANGDAYDVDNPSTGSITTLFRVNGLIGQIAQGGSVTADDLEVITSAVAAAMGNGTAAGRAGARPSDSASGSEEPLGSEDPGIEPSSSPFAPELQAMLPTSLAGTPLTFDSRPASEYFAEGDPTGRAVAASLRKLGKTPADLQIVQGFDDSGATLDAIVAFRLPGADLEALRSIVLKTWLGSGNAGVTQSTVTVEGKTFTKIDYGDAKSNEWVYAKADYVVVVDTSDQAIVAEVAKTLK